MNDIVHPLSPSCQELLVRYGPTVRLEAIPWSELPACLQKMCEHFIERWWNDIDIDQTIEASGLSDMTLSELLAYHERQQQSSSPRAGRRYRLRPFIRVGAEESEPMSYQEALAEKMQQEFLCPENLYRIEEVEVQPSAH